MNIESIREYVLQKPSVTEGFPFDEESLVFKVNSRIFMIASLDESPLRFNVKCDPERAIELRDDYPDTVLPGYHMNKQHWNTIVVDGRLTAKQLKEMIDDSYDLIVKSKKK
ncbi:MAG: MmcQ/YjbR family DNA-binding protein [Chitinophagaceae bacterium]|nr:MmcQ/YjbR family DNA-binding protein [Chitinophagaceae bacterium]